MQAAREPTAAGDGASWIGEQLVADTRWKHILTETEINGLLQMAANFRFLKMLVALTGSHLQAAHP